MDKVAVVSTTVCVLCDGQGRSLEEAMLFLRAKMSMCYLRELRRVRAHLNKKFKIIKTKRNWRRRPTSVTFLQVWAKN